MHIRTCRRTAWRLAACHLAALALMLLALRPGIAQVGGPEVKWDLAAFVGASSASIAYEEMAKQMAAETNGRFKIVMHWSEALVPARTAIDGLKVGAFEMALIASSFHPGKTPTLNALDLPFLPLQDLNVQAKVMLAFYKLPEVDSDTARWDMLPFVPIILPQYELMGKGEAPKDLAALAGKRIRAPGGLGKALGRIGVVPTTVASPEIHGAVERGILDAVSLGHASFKFHRLQDLCQWYTANLSLGIVSSTVGVNRTAWNRLPVGYQDLMQRALRKGLDVQIVKYDETEEEARQTFRAKGLKEVRFGAAEMETFVELAGRPVWEDWIKEMEAAGYPGRRLVEFILAESKRAGS